VVAHLILGIAAVLQTQAGIAPSRPAEVSNLRVVISAPLYQPDGGVSVETVSPSSAAPSVIYVFGRKSVCTTATASATEPNDAGFGWRVSSHTVSATASEIVVSIDWQRRWDRGRRITDGPAGTVQLTLHPGDRIPLDHIQNPQPTDVCRAVGLGLEIRAARAPSTATPAPALPSQLPLGAIEGGAGPRGADVWLVHGLPAGTQQAQHQALRLSADGGAFSFAPVKLSTPQGDVLVEIAGTFRRYRAPSGGEFVLVSMTRNITGDGMPPGGVNGSTGTFIPLPGPEEVLSVEMSSAGAPMRMGRGAGGGGGGGRVARANPAAPGSAPGPAAGASASARARGGFGGGGQATTPPAVLSLLAGHQFSLRFRVTN
jgi:hypothetical protein